MISVLSPTAPIWIAQHGQTALLTSNRVQPGNFQPGKPFVQFGYPGKASSPIVSASTAVQPGNFQSGKPLVQFGYPGVSSPPPPSTGGGIGSLSQEQLAALYLHRRRRKIYPVGTQIRGGLVVVPLR